MKRIAWLSLIALGGCAFAELPPPPPQPMTKAEVLEKRSSESLRTEAQERGVAKLSAEDVVALKNAGIADALLADLIRWERAPVAWNDEMAHEQMHDPWRGGDSKICSVCGGWVRQ